MYIFGCGSSFFHFNFYLKGRGTEINRTCGGSLSRCPQQLGFAQAGARGQKVNASLAHSTGALDMSHQHRFPEYAGTGSKAANGAWIQTQTFWYGMWSSKRFLNCCTQYPLQPFVCGNTHTIKLPILTLSSPTLNAFILSRIHHHYASPKCFLYYSTEILSALNKSSLFCLPTVSNHHPLPLSVKLTTSIPHLSDITQYFPFCNWLISFGTISPGSASASMCQNLSPPPFYFYFLKQWLHGCSGWEG